MAMKELRGCLGRPFEEMRKKSSLDEITVKKCMSEITGTLLEADFPKLVVNQIEEKVQEAINTAAASAKGKIIYQTILEELSRILDPKKSANFEDKRGHNMVMFVGLPGVGKSKTCAQYARHHLKKGFKPALVCADVLRTDAFDRLKKAARDEVPVYGSYTTKDPAMIVIQGIDKFMKEKRDLIVVDTCGRHRKYSPLFVEMSQLAQEVKPDLVILVIDASIGRAAVCAQALAFKQRFAAGVVILTNMNNNLKAIGALGAVAAVGCPMILAETGENGKQFEAFEAGPFVRRLLGNQHADKPPATKFTLRSLYAIYKKELGMTTVGSRPQRNCETSKRYLKIMDSMTDEELDKSSLTLSSKERALEIAKDANVHVKEVLGLMDTYRSEVCLWRWCLRRSVEP